MAIEIERKFIVDPKRIHLDRSTVFSRELKQGYLGIDPASSVRIRLETSIVTGEEQAFLTVKGLSKGASRSEYEYSIPVTDAREMLAICQYTLSKTRWYVLHAEQSWHVDEYHGENAGLITAEIELEDENASVVVPDWATEEVTGDHSYSNLALAINPYRKIDFSPNH